LKKEKERGREKRGKKGGKGVFSLFGCTRNFYAFSDAVGVIVTRKAREQGRKGGGERGKGTGKPSMFTVLFL